MTTLPWLFVALAAHAVSYDPQIANPAAPATLPALATPPVLSTGGVPIQPMVPTPGLPGQAVRAPAPLVYPGAVQPHADENENGESGTEAQALLSAFGLLGGGGGGGGGFGGGGGSSGGGRSEVAYAGDGWGPVGSAGRGSSALSPVGSADLTGARQIIPAFQKWFGKCTNAKGLGDCKFANMGIMGDASHRARRSCHNAGEAIDVGPLTCGGRKIVSSSPQFFDVAKCMANDTNNELQVIFYKAEGANMMQKSDHSQHMHIQLKNCRMVYGR